MLDDKLMISKSKWDSKNLEAELMHLEQMSGKELLKLAEKTKKKKTPSPQGRCYWATFSTKNQHHVTLLKLPCYLTPLQEKSYKKNRTLFLSSVNGKILQILFIRHRTKNPFIYLPEALK